MALLAADHEARLFVFLQLAQAAERPPDYVLFNGRVFTSDSKQLFVEALAVQGERVMAAGSSGKILALAGPETKRVDLAGRLVIPGINDAHYHLFIEPSIRSLTFKSANPDWAEVQKVLSEAVRDIPRGSFVRGDTDLAIWDDSRVARAALDRLAPEHAVILSTVTQHSAILNTLALRQLGIADNEPDPLGGHFGRSKDGALNGRATEYARFLLHRRLSDLATTAEALGKTREFLREAVRLGITSVQIMAIPPSAEQCVFVFTNAPSPIRVRVIPMALPDRNSRFHHDLHGLPKAASRQVTVSGIKWILDGTPIEHTGAVRTPYADNPQTSGELNFSFEDMKAMLRESLEADQQLMVHAVGDRTTEMFLKAMEATGGPAVWFKRRVRIEHGEGLMPDLVSTASRLGVVAVLNPTDQFTLGTWFTNRYGAQNAVLHQPVLSLMKAGVTVALGSDGPLNPYLNIMYASQNPFRPAESLTREEAIIAYTLSAAHAEFAEAEKGSLEPGKLADLAVLTQDILRIPAADLAKTESVLTMVGGKIVYDRLPR